MTKLVGACRGLKEEVQVWAGKRQGRRGIKIMIKMGYTLRGDFTR
jgi:hypothetical protein